MIRLVGEKNEYAKMLLEEAPPAFFRHWLRYLAEAYRAAVTASLDYKQPEGRDLLGHLRRARAEEALANASLEAGLPCHARKNKRKTYRHRVTVAGRFVLVQCHGTYPGEIVRTAEHRVDYASLAAGDLFTGFVESLSVPAERSVFAILQHGAHPKIPSQVGFAVVNFPNVDVDRYISTVDILKRFTDQQASETRTAEVPLLRPKKRSDEGDV